jgi:hypothetical protein
MVAALLALLVSQAASSVCAVECAQHPAMEHCHAMSHAVKGCSTVAVCTVDLLLNKQQETAGPALIHVELRSDVSSPATSPALFSRPPRSSFSSPPLVTALRI